MSRYRLSLFGRELSISSNAPFNDANWGQLNNAVMVTLSNIAGATAQVRITLNGTFPFAPAMKVDVTFAARIEAGRLWLQDALTVRPGTMTVVNGPASDPASTQAGDLTTFALNSPAQFNGDSVSGFVIVLDPNAGLVNYVLQFESLGPLLSPAGDYRFSDAWITFELPAQPNAEIAALYGLVGKTEFEVKDHVDKTRRQKLALEHLRKARPQAQPCRWSLRLRPDIGYLLIGSDRLRKRGPGADPVLYQFAMVNGRMSVEQWGEIGSRESQHTWRPLPGATQATMLALRMTDEHGLPVVLCADDAFHVRHRKGAAGRAIDSFVLTTPRQTPMAVSVRGLDIAALHEDRLIGVDTSAPAWMTDVGAPIASRPPLELHGLARGVRLARSAAGVSSGYSATLITTSAPAASGPEPAYELAELNLDEPGAWKVSLQMPEQSAFAGNDPQLHADVVERHASIGAGTLVMPIMDTAWSLANLLDSGGGSVPGTTVQTILTRLSKLDGQFRDPNPDTDPNPDPKLPRIVGQPHLDASAANMFAQTGGARGRVPSLPDFHQVFSGINLKAAHGAATAHPLPELRPRPVMAPLVASRAGAATPSLQYMHGGAPDSDAPTRLATDVDAGKPFGQQYAGFARTWLQPTPTQTTNVFEPLRAALQLDILNLADALVGKIPVLALQRAARLAEDVAGGALRNLFTASDDRARLDTLQAWLQATAPDEIVAEIADYFTSPDDTDPAFGWVARWFIAPPDQDLFRRLASLFTTNRGWLDSTFPGKAAQFAQALFGGVPTPTPSTLKGFLTEVLEGASPDFAILQQLWKAISPGDLTGLLTQLGIPPATVQFDRVLDLFAGLRDRLGPVLTRDVYAQLLEIKDDAADVLAVLREELQRNLSRLAEIVTDPPEYFVISRRLGVMPPGRSDNLWSHAFDACRQGATPWFWFLDTDSTIVVKSGTRRSMAEVLRELHAAYRQPDRPNPLSVPDGDLDGFIATLEPDIRDKREWIGAFIIRPTIDLSQDEIVSTMTGLNTIEALYVALGGGRPGATAKSGAELDVIARIRKSAPAPDSADRPTARDADLTLVKFDVTVRNTRIAQGEIACQLNLVELFGQTNKLESMLIQAVLPPVNANDPARTFEFGCFFDRPLVVDIGILCVKSVAFRSLKTVKHGGDVAIDIDADLVLQSGGLPMDLGDSPLVRLQDFRIRLPNLGPSNLQMGFARFVAFDFPAISIRLPSPRTLNLSAIDIIPTGLGFLRLTSASAPSAELLDLKARFKGVPIPGFSFRLEDLTDGDYSMPTVKLLLDLGKLPGLGGGGSFQLELVLGARVIRGQQSPTDVFVGVGGFEADHLKIDLFRIITLEIDKLLFSSDYAAGLKQANTTKVGLLLAEKIRLKILDWSPLDQNDDLSFAYMNAADPKGGAEKSWLVSLQTRAPPDRFLQIYGLVLAKGIGFDQKFYNLLLGQLDSAQSVVPGFIDTAAKRIRADLGSDLPWLLAITFGLRGILDRCALVLQDGRYYGIRLSAPWVRAVFDLDNLSLSYIPGPTRTRDKFRIAATIPALNMIANMRSGEVALEWAVNQDFLVDVGFPWFDSQGYNWFRAFSIPAGAYEVKFGFYFEKRSHIEPQGQSVTFGAGFALYAGYFFGMGNSVAWLRAGIGVFAVLQAQLTIDLSAKVTGINDLPNIIEGVVIVGAIGIFAYGEGGIDVWVLSARFRVSAQASVTVMIVVVRGQPTALSYTVSLAVGYSASVSIGCGFFSWTFSVSGTLSIPVSGRLLLG
jgi:hypothetical protein